MDIYIWIIWIYMASLTDWCMRIAKNQNKSSGILQINSVQLPAAEQKTEKRQAVSLVKLFRMPGKWR